MFRDQLRKTSTRFGKARCEHRPIVKTAIGADGVFGKPALPATQFRHCGSAPARPLDPSVLI